MNTVKRNGEKKMTENLMPRIAQMLGIELDVDFKIRAFDYTFRLTEKGLMRKELGNRWRNHPDILTELCTGNYEIDTTKWKPKIGEYYWTFDKSNASTCIRWTVGCFFWENSPFDICAFKNGWVFRTEDEAEEALPVVAKEMGVYY